MRTLPQVVRTVFSALGFAGCVACADTAEQTAELESGSPEAQDLILVDEPAVRIGGNDDRPEYFIQYTSGALRLSDGRIVVADDGTRELRYFDPQGNHVRTVGGRGGGPGEFQRLRTIARLKADTIFAWDLIQSRGTLFSPEGDVVRTLSLSSLEGIRRDLQTRFPQHFMAGSTIYPLQSDLIVIEPFPEPNLQAIPETHLMQDTFPLFLVDRIGENPLEVGPFPGTQWFRHRSMTRLPFGESLRLAAGADVLYVGSTRDRFIRIISGRDGEELGRIALPLQAHVPSPEDVELVRSRMVERIVPSARESMVAYVDAVPWPATFPVFGQLRAASDGGVWVQAYQRPSDSSQEWLMFDQSGTHISTVRLDGSYEVLDAGADYVIVQLTDELGVEELRLYHLKPRD
jgi:hypothetical protein